MSQNADINEKGNESVFAFASFAEKYEKGTGGATRYVAQRLVSMSPPFSDGSVVLDNACGTGIVTEEIQRHLQSTTQGTDGNINVQVYGADAAPPMVEIFQAKVKHAKENGTWPNLKIVSLRTVPAEELDETIVPSNSITHSYMNFGLFFCTDPVKAAGHIYRSLAPGGTAFITSWADLGYINAMRKTEKSCDPDSAELRMPFDEQWENPAYVKEVLQKAGFEQDNIKVVQEDSFFRAKDMNEMASLHTDLFTMLIRGPKGWASEDARKQWTSKLIEFLSTDDHFIQEENGVATRMRANVAICKK
ncbi:hypothetical protein H2198_005546 [Neophaeococcomyces mojaviensis]|uniref:Uncharacterized protein n=1 Tax=Neophaeococcomyces mojaviensis TaxID=3383035 RepID=A0ACC3A5D9_9EURO|nr:hypothetical protein H2198_005546 [Knufia sp. JES_112]